MLDLEMSCVQLHSGLNMLYTIQEAMAEKSGGQANYAEALYGVYDYLKSVESNIAEIAIKRAPPGVRSTQRGSKPN